MKDMAHPDPRVRYFAHEVVQPIDRWQAIAYRIAEALTLVATLGVLAYVFFFRGLA